MRLPALVSLLAACGATGPAGPPGPPPPEGSPPSGTPAGVAFTDLDPRQDLVSGTITVSPAADESDLTGYAVYWGSDATTRASTAPIVVIAKTGAMVSFPLRIGTPVPAGATQLLAYAVNDDGDGATPAATALADNYPAVVDLSMGMPAGTYGVPVSPVLDVAGGRLLFLSRVTGESVLFQCATDATQCTTTDLGSSGFNRIALDTAAMVLTGPGTNAMFCSLAGNGCLTRDLAAGTAVSGGQTVGAAVFDHANSKMLIATGGSTVGVLRTALDGTGPAYTSLVPALGITWYTARTWIDTVSGKLFVVASGAETSTAIYSVFYRCNLDVTGCTQPYVVPFDALEGVAVDDATQHVKIAGYTLSTGAGVLVDCDAALANCNAIDPADGLAWTPYQPALDAAHHALYMLGVDSIFGTFALERCDASGTPCAQIALPPGIAGNNAYVIDESAGRLTMPYLDTATNKLAAFNLRSW